MQSYCEQVRSSKYTLNQFLKAIVQNRICTQQGIKQETVCGATWIRICSQGTGAKTGVPQPQTRHLLDLSIWKSTGQKMKS